MSAHEHATHEHGHGGPKTFGVTLAVLLVLTVITVIVAGFDLGNTNVVVAIGIATVKATLVALIFMHLRHDKPINAVIAVSGFLFLGLLLMFCMTDIDARLNPTPGTLKVAPKAAAPSGAGDHLLSPASSSHQ
jgi:cytochrome c oxidase subunit IV